MGLFGEVVSKLIQKKANDDRVEEAIAESTDEMYSMVGNEGQEVIMTQGMEGFISWAVNCVRKGASGGGCSLQEFDERVAVPLGDEKYMATSEIWDAGMEIVVSYAEEAEEAAGEASEMAGD